MGYNRCVEVVVRLLRHLCHAVAVARFPKLWRGYQSCGEVTLAVCGKFTKICGEITCGGYLHPVYHNSKFCNSAGQLDNWNRYQKAYFYFGPSSTVGQTITVGMIIFPRGGGRCAKFPKPFRPCILSSCPGPGRQVS